MTKNPDKKILVILGAGHIDEVLELVKSEEAFIASAFLLGSFSICLNKEN